MVDYELTTLSLGGGVQSSAIAEMIVEGELPLVDFAIFADTGDEPAHVYKHVWYLAGRLATVGVPLIVVNNGDMVADAYSGGRFAAMPLFTVSMTQVDGFGMSDERRQVGRLKRQCTSEYKIVPIERFIRRALLRRGLAWQNSVGAIHINQGVRVQSWLGITTDEAERMKPNQTAWIDNAWPLIDRRLSRQDCIDWLRARGLPVPLKSSCKRCPYHHDDYWRDMQATRPNEWAEVVTFDHDLRDGDKLRLAATAKGELFIHQHCIPLDEVDLTPKTNGQLAFSFCDEGFCWT